MEKLENNALVGVAFEDLSFEEMQLSQGKEEIGAQSISSPFVVSATISFVASASVTAWTR
ncbi:MAG: lichenicidin A2 family type 2 lantibiotic [Defluviitaleaceae bacterium]|nr:lichenicidin A2 family type 2 lantibiotic [Defluviitaleaceae bacterium]